eukprot:scaffold1203_cov74-Phaeocystis_antarctica.AAC.7
MTVVAICANQFNLRKDTVGSERGAWGKAAIPSTCSVVSGGGASMGGAGVEAERTLGSTPLHRLPPRSRKARRGRLLCTLGWSAMSRHRSHAQRRALRARSPAQPLVSPGPPAE